MIEVAEETPVYETVINLEEKILNELESNPVLEQSESDEDEEAVEPEAEVDYEEDPDEYEPANIYDNTQSKDRDIPMAEQVDFVEGLVRQLDGFNLANWEHDIAEEIIWNLDENGYLAVDTILIADRYDKTKEAVVSVLKKVQQLDPPGIAARDLQDCLLIQLNGKEQTIAYQIISEYFDDFANHRYETLQERWVQVRRR